LLEDQLEEILDSPEERAKWIRRFRIAYLLWMIMLVLGILFLALYYLIK